MITTVTLATRSGPHGAEARSSSRTSPRSRTSAASTSSAATRPGPLTTGEMTLDAHVDPRGMPTERPLLLAYVNSLLREWRRQPARRRRSPAERPLNPLDAAVLRHEHPPTSRVREDRRGPVRLRAPARERCRRAGRRASRSSPRGRPSSVLPICEQVRSGRRRCSPSIRTPRARGGIDVPSAWGRRLSRPRRGVCSAVQERATYSKEDERELTLAGYVAFVDPPREDARRRPRSARARTGSTSRS